MNLSRPQLRTGSRRVCAHLPSLTICALLALGAGPALAQEANGAGEVGLADERDVAEAVAEAESAEAAEKQEVAEQIEAVEIVEQAEATELAGALPAESAELEVPATRLAVLPFRIHSSRSFGYLTKSLADLLAARLASMGNIEIVAADSVREAIRTESQSRVEQLEAGTTELSDFELRRLAQQVGADAMVTGSVTELVGRFSLDVRLTPAASGQRSHTIVFTADSEQELVDRLDDVADRVAASAAQGTSAKIVEITIDGAPEIEARLRELLTIEVGEEYDPVKLDGDRLRLEREVAVASASAETERSQDGVKIHLRILPTALLFGLDASDVVGAPVVEIVVRGNRRVESGAVLSRIQTRVGEPIRSAQLAADVRDVFGTGFFRDVRVFTEEIEGGLVLIFEVEESPVIREITISGNEEVEDEDVTEVLTLTTSSTLDYPLLLENVERIRQLYRAQGYYLAAVGYEIEERAPGSIAIHFEVTENEKLKLREIEFSGNEAFSDKQLREDFAIKKWHFLSWATSWFDKSGTYSEPIFMHDLQVIERMYSDAGFLQVEMGQPQVVADEDGLRVTVEIAEGPRFHVGTLTVTGDETMDLDGLRGNLLLAEGAIFNRSFLTQDVEALEAHYTDRGFYFASVQPRTQLEQVEKLVDVDFHVQKGPLYFIRNVNILGNTRTVDPVIRREMKVVEGQLYSARALQLSTMRVRGLGFFEDVAFEPKTTEDPSQLDLQVNIVERPTGSFSFGAGYSSQDKVVFTASLSQSNLFGRGYGLSLSADVGGRTNRFYLSFSDPRFLGTDFSFGTTIFITDINFDDFQQEQRGFDLSLGHSLSEDNTARGFLRYSFASRRIRQDTRINASAPIFRELIQGNETSSLIGASMRRDTRNDRYSATRGTNSGLTFEYSGLGGFSNFLRIEGRHAWYMGAPGWLIKNSTFVLGGRVGYTVPFNTWMDYDLGLEDVPKCRIPGQCVEVANLDQISRDVTLPLSERYFLGGIGSFQLRGYEARSVGPRRAVLRRSGVLGEGNLFYPTGRELQPDANTGILEAVCTDVDGSTQGNRNGRCNSLDDTQLSDFDDLLETDVIGGSKFFTVALEYRFPISEEIGLQGVVFFDMGGSFAEEDRLFDTDYWRYGYGGGVLWFSPFGPLQLVLGFPVNPYAFEKSPVFEFSVGGFGL